MGMGLEIMNRKEREEKVIKGRSKEVERSEEERVEL